MSDPIQRLVIVGGGSAGWMTAAALSSVLPSNRYSITLVESEAIGTVGVGEATLPHLRFFNQRLGISEPEFMRETRATYKLGIEFNHWGKLGDSYIHPFGEFGRPINGIGFHHYWLRLRSSVSADPIGDYSLPVVAAQAGRFAYPATDPESILSSYSYAYQMDSTLYAKFLRGRAESQGVTRVEGLIGEVKQDSASGNITAVKTQNGKEIEGDLFVDCSGFRGLLIEQTLNAGYENWQHWLPCDRAVAVACETAGTPLPYTRATADRAGWRWRIPLTHRTGNGHVYCSEFTDDETALNSLLEGLDGAPINDPNPLRFTTGRRRRMWVKNCVAIGLSAGFLEPLESTGIHLIQLGIMKLMEYLPGRPHDPTCADEFNRLMQMEIERIRDFLVLHYTATRRDDSPFWDHCRTMRRPDSLNEKWELFARRGHVDRYTEGLFLEPSWIAVYLGQRVIPQHYDPRVDAISLTTLGQAMSNMTGLIKGAANSLPEHAKALESLRDEQVQPNQGWKQSAMSLYRAT
ncbi:MAG: tryptophan halogenase family protein [Lysobacterales bacterium]